MEEIKRYQIRGLPGAVNRLRFSGRLVDYWAPPGGSDHLLIAHDGQNIFDRRTATFRFTWRLAQNASRVAAQVGKKPPLIIAVFHSKSEIDPHGRAKDLCPEDPFREGLQPKERPEITVADLRGNAYLDEIFTKIIPNIADRSKSYIPPSKSAMIGSSMGALATLYAATKYDSYFHTALALSPHWVLAGDGLVDWILPRIPNEAKMKIWMSRGTRGLDASYPPFQDRADRLMRELGWDEARFKSRVFQGTAHNERSWASYVDQPLRFWLS